MTPIKYTRKDNVTHFHYSISDLRLYIKYCYEGCAGALLWNIDRSTNIVTYKVSGTFENPYPIKNIRDLRTLRMKHNDIFDGKLETDDEYLIPPKLIFNNLKLVWIDMSDYDGKPNIQKL